MPKRKRKLVFQPSIFRYMLVSGRVTFLPAPRIGDAFVVRQQLEELRSPSRHVNGETAVSSKEKTRASSDRIGLVEAMKTTLVVTQWSFVIWNPTLEVMTLCLYILLWKQMHTWCELMYRDYEIAFGNGNPMEFHWTSIMKWDIRPRSWTSRKDRLPLPSFCTG